MRLMTLARVIRHEHRHSHQGYVIGHRNQSRGLAGDLKAFLDGGYGAVEVGKAHVEKSSREAVNQHISLLIREPVGEGIG